jgi:predicted RNA-binding protein (virulence factor B family)
VSTARIDDLLGRVVTLPILRIGTPGAFLALVPEDPRSEVILLLGSELEPGAKEGDLLSVFIHRDSEGRPLATTRTPKLTLDQVTFLEVTSRTSVGVFVDWGLPKELLVPFAEETTEMRVGERYAVGLYVDASGRLAGTMRVAELLSEAAYPLDSWVVGEAWRKVPEVGLFVIVEKTSVGLLPKEEHHELARGESARFRVSHVHADGKIELSLRGHAHAELAGDAERILAALRKPGAAPIADRASPEELRARFGLSRKAWKRAVGRLLRERKVDIDDAGILHLVK